MRWAKRGAVALVLVVLALAAPAAWIEATCTTAREAGTLRRTPLVSDPGYAHPESESYLSYPEWHAIYAYEDLAAVLRHGDESAFAYGRQIAGFWSSLCRITAVVSARETMGRDARMSLYMTGWRFTTEMAIKGAYEKTGGRFFEWLRGPGKTAEDEFAARDTQAYAEFLRQMPWYEYPFGWRLLAYWRGTSWRGGQLERKVERRLVQSGEYATRAISGALIGSFTPQGAGAPRAEIQTVVAGPGDTVRDSPVKVVRPLAGGRTLMRMPRGQAYTAWLVGFARRGGEVVEIAGNHRILLTVLAPPGAVPTVAGVTPLFEVAIQSRPDRRRVGLDVEVERLAAAIRALEAAGIALEHIYGY